MPTRKTAWSQLVFFLVAYTNLVNLSKSSPVFSHTLQFSQFQSARNIRNLPCLVRRSGMKGVCMFAIDCLKSNGTHLGTCIDMFYFGSCCQIKNVDSIYSNPEISDNSIDSHFPPSKESVLISDKPYLPVTLSTTTAVTTSKFPTNTSYEFVSSSSRHPVSTSTEKYTVSIGAFNTTLGAITYRNVSKTTTENVQLSTFHSVQSDVPTTSKPITHTTLVKATTKKTTLKPVQKSTSRPTVPSRKPIRNTITSKVTPTAKPVGLNNSTRKPTVSSTKKVIITTAKPITTITKITTKSSSSVRPSTHSFPQSSNSSKKIFTKPTVAPSLTTVSFIESTKAPRPKPQPTDYIVKVPPTTLIDEDIITTSFSIEILEKTTPNPFKSTDKPTTSQKVSIAKVSTKKPYIKDVSTGSTKQEQLTTFSKFSNILDSSTMSSEFVTWTISDSLKENVTKGNNWVLISSGVPETTPIPTSFNDSFIKMNETVTKAPFEFSTIIDSTIYALPLTTTNASPTSKITLSSKLPDSTTENLVSVSTSTLINTMKDKTDSTETTVSNLETTSLEDNEDSTNPTTIIDDYTSSSNMTADLETSTVAIPSLEGIDYKQICGKRMFPEPRIVGGTKASFGRWPWQISLRQWRTSTYLHKCGAALLNDNWAISAAHCVDNVPPSDLLLRLGEYDLSIEEEPYGYQERRVQIVASHPQFDPRTFEYDLALLRFYEPVIFQPNIIPVCVPENDENFVGTNAHVTGWGRLYEDGPLPSVLQEVTVPVIENAICESMYRNAGYIEHIPHIFICAGWKKGGYDSCEGDSGGPLVIQRTEDKRFQLAGVISWGIGCAEPNQPGVYTRISEFRDWINQILQF